MTWKLKRVRQCAKCPWKTSTDPHDIPDGYCETRHRNLASTIAEPGVLPRTLGPAMACHEHPVGEEAHCVGWLWNQMGTGNNLGLRLALMDCENAHAITVDGEQHEDFADTLPSPD